MKSSRFLLSLVILLLAVALPSRAADAPVITAVSPRQVPAGSPGFTLVVQGRSFDKSSVVLCNGSERNTTWVSDHMLRAAILTSDVAKRGTLHIAVQVNGDDDEVRSNSARVMVYAAAGPQPVKITTTSLAAAQVGAAYSAALTATSGKPPYHWTLAAGALPGVAGFEWADLRHAQGVGQFPRDGERAGFLHSCGINRYRGVFT